VTDPAPQHRRARPISLAESPADRLSVLIGVSGTQGVPVHAIAVRTGATPAAVSLLLDDLGAKAVRAGDLLVSREVLDSLAHEVVRHVENHHASQPLERGASVQSVRAGLHAPPEVADLAIRHSSDLNLVRRDGALLSIPGFVPRLSAEENQIAEQLLDAIRRAGREPPSLGELSRTISSHTSSIMRFLEARGTVIPVEADRYYASEVLRESVESLQAAMEPGREYTPQELRDILGISRKFLIPLLEYCDRTGVTERRLGCRVRTEAPLTPGPVPLA
jgi:selenocysteine-specific elongation factor